MVILSTVLKHLTRRCGLIRTRTYPLPAAHFIVRTTIALVLLALTNLVQAVDINDVQTQIFTPTCAVSGCHRGTQSPNLRAGQAFTNIVNVPSSQVPSLFYIEPGNPGNSYLVRKIQGTGSGSQMPFLRPPLSSSLITLVRDWVLQGALEMEVAVCVYCFSGIQWKCVVNIERAVIVIICVDIVTNAITIGIHAGDFHF